jgi:hypothetical protein
MTLALAIMLIGIAALAYMLAAQYVAFATRSFASANKVWNDLNEKANAILEEDIPVGVARIVFALTATAGCGCYVRGMLIGLYAPVPRGAMSHSDASWDKAFGGLDALPQKTRDEVSRLMAIAMVYDSYRNPLQGWIFRHAVKQYARGEPSFFDKLEAQLLALSVLSRPSTKRRIAANILPIGG